jgi:hypothetical protein
MFRKILAIIVVTLLLSANAHFFINDPPPIPDSAIKDPLESSGSNFPCHGADLSKPTARTAMAVGDTQPLGFELGNGTNTAVHGGGSCQISIAYETDPVKVRDPDNWKVIMSYIGGCPTDAHGNLPTAVACNGKNSTDCVNNLSFKIPPEVKDGNATLAWTWFNNVGNREMYMNCAAVSVTGGQNQISALPTMFVANLASINQCQTTEDYNIDFPAPGRYVQKETPLNYPLKAPVGSGCEVMLGSGSVTSTRIQTSAAPEYSSSSVSSTPTSTQTALPADNSPAGVCQNGAIPCSTPEFFCINDTTYGECAFGCAIPMRMSLGTNCVNNTIVFAQRAKTRRRV